VVRIADIIAYLGKDRQDASRAKIPLDNGLEGLNGELINNIIVSIVENSYGKNYISISDVEYAKVQKAKDDNYKMIYKREEVQKRYSPLASMFKRIYDYMLKELKANNKKSLIYDHHIDYVKHNRASYIPQTDYEKEDANILVADYIASMTDDYFIELHRYLFPKAPDTLEYIDYFGNKKI
jgi:dGTPase